jgi:hypothetical protein
VPGLERRNGCGSYQTCKFGRPADDETVELHFKNLGAHLIDMWLEADPFFWLPQFEALKSPSFKVRDMKRSDPVTQAG